MENHPKALSSKALTAFFLALVASISVLVYFEFATTTDLTENTFITLATAEVLPFDHSLEQIQNTDAQWQQVEFPFHWREREFDTRAVWYRFEVSASDFDMLDSSEENEPWGVYIWRLNQTADIWFNGVKIGSGGNSGDKMARYWNTPLYFSIPSSLVETENEILIKHFAQHSWGSIPAPVIGPESFLRPVHTLRYFVQHDIALSLFVFVLVTGLFSFSVWLYRPSEPQYFWFAISSVGLSFYCLNQFIRYLPISADAWRWLSNVSIDLWASTIFIFMIRTLKIDKPYLVNIALGFVITGIPVYYYASFYKVFDLNIYFHIGSLLIAIASFGISLSHYLKTKENLSAFYCCVIFLVFLAGLHDTVMQAIVNNGWKEYSAITFSNHFNFVHFAAPLIFLFIGISLIRRFIDSMNAADLLNSKLEQRVENAKIEIARTHQAVEDAIALQSASQERERIYRDLHDDVGSKLLSLYYRLDNESDSTLAKSALEDLRDIVSHKTLDSCALEDAVAQWQQEVSERVSDQSVNLSWEFEHDAEKIVLSELQHTHLRRMLREVLSNAILHSTSLSVIKIEISCRNQLLSISVSNDGAPKPVSAWKPGRGISNLRVRTRDLGGVFSITDLEDSWVEISWQTPVGNVEGINQ